MRERIVERLGEVPHGRFLVYLMGPYKSFDPKELVPDDADEEDLPGWLTWDESEGKYDHDEVLAILRRLQGTLRAESGVNAFLAVDVDIDLDEMNAVRQSIEFAHAANVVVFVIPLVGKNVGVGIEVGSVLREDDVERERVLFVHESGVQSAMIKGIGDEWDVDVQRYSDEGELARKVRLFVMEVMERESHPEFDLKPME